MNDTMIQTLWNEGKEKELKMSRQEIDGMLEKSVRRAWTDLRRMVWIYLAMMMATLVVSGMNIAGYASKPVWRGVNLGLVLLTAVFLVFGTHLLAEMRRLDDPKQGLIELVRRKLRFFRTKYQVWLGIVALAIWVLGFAVSLQLYNQDGHYRIKKDLFILGFAMVQLLLIYLIVRVAHYPLIQRMLAALRDLETQATQETGRFEERQKYRVLIAVLAFVLGVALFAALLVRFLA